MAFTPMTNRNLPKKQEKTTKKQRLAEQEKNKAHAKQMALNKSNANSASNKAKGKNEPEDYSEHRKRETAKESGGYMPYTHLDEIGLIPLHYGFTPKKSPEIKKVDLDISKNFLDGDYVDEPSYGGSNEKGEKLPLHVEEKVAVLRMYHEEELSQAPQPVMLYFKNSFTGGNINSNSQGKGHYHRYADLEILGTNKSIAEAMLIQTVRTMLKEEGYKETGVTINSIGDRDSIARHTRDLIAYYRKHVNNMHAECRQILKRDPFELLSCTSEKCKVLNEHAPKSMNYLTEASRLHFREVLEYLEALEIPYTINNHLLGNRKYCTETIFEIVNLSEEAQSEKSKQPRTLAIGVRYDSLAKRAGYKRDLPAVGVSVLVKGNDASLRKTVTKSKVPKVTFIQLGFEAKLKSLVVMEMLRKAKIPVYQSLSKDKFGVQVNSSERNQTPYTIIMGKREALEQTVIVRNTETRSQVSVPISQLTDYIKKLDI